MIEAKPKAGSPDNAEAYPHYIKGTIGLGVQLHAATSPMITAYSDAD